MTVSWTSATIRVTGNRMDIVSMLQTDTAPSYKSYTFTQQGTMLMWTTICGPDRAVRGYTATTNVLRIMSGNNNNGGWNAVDIYTKR